MKPLLLFLTTSALSAALPEEGLLLDLDAMKGLTLEEGARVAAWKNQVADVNARVFVQQDGGREERGGGRPTLRSAIPELGGKSALVFRQQELVCMEEDVFDSLTTGKGHTWLAVLAVLPQRNGLKDVNSFFGNLRNGGKYEGVWGCLHDDNSLWYGVRNGRTMGRFDDNNPKLLGPVLETGTFHVIGGRMAAGTGKAKLELFANHSEPVATGEAPVDPASNPSKMTIGQERDAIEHPGYESFDGEIARFLIWARPLTDEELADAMEVLRSTYLKN